MSIIRTENLEKTYQDNGVPVKALRGVSMTIEPGEFTVIAGPSGSGKTTLLNLIGALDVPTAGTVMLENAVLAELSRDQLSDLRLRKIGFVFQAYNLIPVLSAIENVGAEQASLAHEVHDGAQRCFRKRSHRTRNESAQ